MRPWFMVVLAVAFTPLPADAQSISSTGIACNTVEQVIHFVDLVSTGTSAGEAFEKTNRVFDSPDAERWSCGFTTIAYHPLRKAGRHITLIGPVEIFEVTILGFKKDGLWIPAIPVIQYIPIYPPRIAGVDL